MPTFFNKFKKPGFYDIFGPFSQFLRQKNSRKPGSVTYSFIQISNTIPKFKGKMDGSIDRPYFIGPSGQRRGSNKTSRQVQIRCWNRSIQVNLLKQDENETFTWNRINKMGVRIEFQIFERLQFVELFGLLSLSKLRNYFA